MTLNIRTTHIPKPVLYTVMGCSWLIHNVTRYLYPCYDIVLESWFLMMWYICIYQKLHLYISHICHYICHSLRWHISCWRQKYYKSAQNGLKRVKCNKQLCLGWHIFATLIGFSGTVLMAGTSRHWTRDNMSDSPALYIIVVSILMLLAQGNAHSLQTAEKFSCPMWGKKTIYIYKYIYI